MIPVNRKERRLWKVYKTTKNHEEYQSYLNVQRSFYKILCSNKNELELANYTMKSGSLTYHCKNGTLLLGIQGVHALEV